MKIPSEKGRLYPPGIMLKVSSKVPGAKHQLEMIKAELQESRTSNALSVCFTAKCSRRDTVHSSGTSCSTSPWSPLGLHRVLTNVCINARVE